MSTCKATESPFHASQSRQTSRPTTVNSNPNEKQNNLIHKLPGNPITHAQPLRRRSKSTENLSSKPYLSHKPLETIKTGTILQPNCKVSKHVHVPTNKDLQGHQKYLLTAQTVDSEGEVQTQFLKGEITKTRKLHEKDGQGIAVQFTDVEILKTRDPTATATGNQVARGFIPSTAPTSPRKRNSAEMEELSNCPSQWTDVQTRCRQAVEQKKGEIGPTVTNMKRTKGDSR